MYPEEGLELNLLIAVGVGLRQEGGDLLLGDHLIEPPQLLHQPRQILRGDMAGIPLQRHELQHRQNKITNRNETDQPRATQLRFPAQQRGGRRESTDSDITLALSDRSSTCVNCPCSDGSDTTTPTNPADISPPPRPDSARARSGCKRNPDQGGSRPGRNGTPPGKSKRGGGPAPPTARRGEEIPFELVTAIPPLARAGFLALDGKKASNGVQVSRFRGGRGAEAKWWRRGGEVRAGVGPVFFCLFFPFPVAELGFPRG